LAEQISQDDLQQTFDRMWSEIRGAKLYAGQPRNEASACSVSWAQRALELATNAGIDRFLLEAWKMLAYSLTANEQYEDSLLYHQKAIERLEQIGQPRQAARNRIGYVAALIYAANYAEAIEVAAEAERSFIENQDDAGRARLLTNLGILYARLDNYSKAVECYSTAAEIFERLGEKQAAAQTYQNLANIFANLDRFEEADDLYQQTEQLSGELNLPELSMQASYNRAYLQYLRGHYSRALQLFSRLRQRFQKAGSQRHRALCDLDEAEIYLQLNLSKDACVLAQNAIEQFKELGLAHEQAKAITFFGVALMQMRQFAAALDAFGEAQKIFENEGNLYWIGLLDLYRAEVHFSLRRLSEARRLAAQAKITFDRLAIPSKRIFSLVLLGRVALALNDVAGAAAASREIAALVEATEMPLMLFPYHVLCGQIAERESNWDEAKVSYERAAEELERHQARLHHDDLRVTFFKGRQHAYDALVRLSLDRMDTGHSLAAAYAWCERARSRGLIELLSHCAPSIHTQAERSLLAKINRLRDELNTQYARSQPEARPLTAQASYENIAAKEQELARALREISAVDPEYASLHQVSIATIESVREALPDKTTLVEYFTAGDEILAFIVSRGEARVVRRLGSPRRIANLQDRLRFQIEKFLLSPDYVRSHAEQILESLRCRLQELYRHLMAPFIHEIRTQHIAIVPHGSLHLLPFHAFFDGEQYIIDRFEISYAPSASVLKYCLEKPEVPGNSPLLVGVADEKVPLVNEELARISGLFPAARILQGDQATRSAFVDNCKGASFVHIATHAVFRQDNPMFSSFKLADGYTTASDLFSLTCPTNLVTLSGCQSGVSEVTGSDDLLGLMRGFLYAGARSLLVSLWNVNDQSTAALMANFYREWKQGADKSTALRKAMLFIRQEYPSPFYWAPFLLVGNP
jgi:CHAT domain-containing protein